MKVRARGTYAYTRIAYIRSIEKSFPSSPTPQKQERELLESTLERRFVNMVRKAGGKAYKFVSPGNLGVPDRIAILPRGRIWFVELKTETGRLSQVQKRQIDTLRSLGMNVFVLWGEKGLQRFREEVIERGI